jgi:stress response protein YsnF
MHGQCLVAVYPSRNEAEQAFRAVAGSGIPSNNIRISGGEPHVWDWLFSRHVPERDRTFYRTHLAEGRTALSVLLDGGSSPASINAVEEILERYHPVDVHIEQEEAASAAVAGRPDAAKEAAKAGGPAAAGAEQIIPLPREELQVGTRAADRVRHIRTYVVEEPVEKEVSLSDEEVIIERRPATTSAAGEISERDYEFHERHEEPVVEKKTRADEELVVHKEAKQHTERVRGTVRRTKADIARETGAQLSPKDRGGR